MQKKQTDAQLSGLSEDNISLTNTQGKAEIKLSATKPGPVRVFAYIIRDSDNNLTPALNELNFMFKKTNNKPLISINPKHPLVGETVTVTVKDQTSPKGTIVKWTATGVGAQAPVFAQLSLDKHGEASARYKSDTPGELTVTTTLGGTDTAKSLNIASPKIVFLQYDLVEPSPIEPSFLLP